MRSTLSTNITRGWRDLLGALTHLAALPLETARALLLLLPPYGTNTTRGKRDLLGALTRLAALPLETARAPLLLLPSNLPSQEAQGV